MSNKNPLAYTGMIEATTQRAGDTQFNSTQFSVTNGVVSLAGGGLAVDSLSSDSGSSAPTAAGVITIAGGNGIDTSATGSTVTIAGETSSDTNPGIIEIATDAEAQAKADTERALVPSNLAALDASTTASGLIEIATDAEAQAKSASDRAIVPSNLLASGFLQWADILLSNAEIKALRATPIQVVAAPAAGNIIMFLGAMLKLNYGGTNVFTETDDNLAIRYTDGSGAIVSQAIETTGFIDQSADTITNALPKIDAIVAAASGEAQALVIHNTGDGEIAGNAGNDNTVNLRVYYLVQALA